MRLISDRLLVCAFVALLTACAALLTASAALASARAQLQTSTRRLVLDEELRVTISASGEFSQMTELASPGFEFRSAGRQSQVSIVNGDIERVENFTFVGTPSQVGKFTIGPVELYLGGQVVARTAAVEIEVVGHVEVTGPAVAADQASDLRRYAGQTAFVRPVLSNSSPFVGEPVVLTYELYWSRNTQISGVRETAGPKYSDLDPFDLLKQRPEAESVQIGGRVYQRTITHRVLLTPQRSGKALLQGPIFRLDMGDFFETRAVKVAAPLLELTVREVPTQGRPAGHDPNSVGSLRARAQLSAGGTVSPNQRVKVGERLLLQYEVSGEGNILNLKAITPPPVAGMTVEALPTRATDGVQHSERGTHGQRIWQYVVSFEHPGRFEVAAVQFGCYDPKTSAYTVDTLGPFVVDVIGEGPAAVPTTGAYRAGSVVPAVIGGPAHTGQPESLGGPPKAALPQRQVPRPIAAQLELGASHDQPWHARSWIWVVGSVPWLLMGLLWLLGLWRRRQAALAPQRARASALDLALGELETTATLAQDAAYPVMRRTVAAYLTCNGISDPLNASEAVFVARLGQRGIDNNAARKLSELLQHCDYARYAPSSDYAGAAVSTATDLATTLRLVETQWKAPDAMPNAVFVALVGLGLCGTLLAVNPVLAVSLDAEFAAANRQYVSGNFGGAAAAYARLLARGAPSAALHYNLANAQYQSNQMGWAVAHYRQALRLQPTADLRQDIEASLASVRSDLAELARRRHQTLHVFDESPEIDIALSRAAPRSALALLVMLAGAGVLGLFEWQRRRSINWKPMTVLCILAVVQIAAGAWLAFAAHIDATVTTAVVIEEDAALRACRGVGEPTGLPEGIELRQIAELADGRMHVRLSNGRQGCMAAAALHVVR
ncbi:MAG: hypothetical protein EXR77_16580 [Myxococcales bacterium]|nr:hypothetical protein [Myxococcales bacterium]